MQQEIFTFGNNDDNNNTFHTNEKIKTIKSGTNAVLFINDKQELFRKGINNFGRLGFPIYLQEIKEFTKINISNIKLIECGDTCSIFTTIYNEIFISGQNRYGQLGLEDYNNRDSYTKINNFNEKIKFLRCGPIFTFIVTINNKIYGCGHNGTGQLGIPLTKETENINKLTEIKINLEIKDLQCGGHHTVILDKNGNVFACGSNTSGQLGLGNINQISEFTKLSINHKNNKSNDCIKQISCFYSGTFFLTNENKLFGCGENIMGQLGLKIGKSYYTEIVEISFQNCLLNNNKLINNNNKIIIKQIFTTFIGEYNIILTENDEIYGTGLDDNGQLGLNKEEYLIDEDENEFVDCFKKLNFIKKYRYVTVVAEYYNLFILNSNHKINVEENVEEIYLKENLLGLLNNCNVDDEYNNMVDSNDGKKNNFVDVTIDVINGDSCKRELSVVNNNNDNNEPILKKQKIII